MLSRSAACLAIYGRRPLEELVEANALLYSISLAHCRLNTEIRWSKLHLLSAPASRATSAQRTGLKRDRLSIEMSLLARLILLLQLESKSSLQSPRFEAFYDLLHSTCLVDNGLNKEISVYRDREASIKHREETAISSLLTIAITQVQNFYGCIPLKHIGPSRG
jgi:hypothetical protein